jgi:hypothetical protein
MRITGANEMHLMTLHALESHPYVTVQLIDDMADVEGAVSVRKRGCYEYLSGHLELLRSMNGNCGWI